MGKAARPASELERRSRREGGKQAPALTARTWETWLDFVKAQAGPRVHFVVWLTGALGLRCGEAVALRREDFALDAEEPYARAAGHVTGAKKSPGYVFVKRSNLKWLKQALAKGIQSTRGVKTKHGIRKRNETHMPPATGFLFQARAGSADKHFGYMAVYHCVKALAPPFLHSLQAQKAKHDPRVAQLTPHSGRATFITTLMADGYNLRTTMKQARHSAGSVKVHLRYGQLTLADVKHAVDRSAAAKAGLDLRLCKR